MIRYSLSDFHIAKITAAILRVRPELMFEGQFSKDQFGNPMYDVSPDGQRFVVVRGTEKFLSKIHVILNWFDELHRLAPRD